MLDKGILTEIDSLDQGELGCFASNDHLAQFCQCSTTKVSTSISKLVELGYVRVVAFDGRKRVLKSSLSKNERQTFKNCKADFQKLKDSNTSTNTTNNPPSYYDDEDDNPYGDTSGDRPRFDTVQAYANNNLNALGVRAMEELNDFVASTSEEVVRHAIDNALDSGVRTWAYVRAILNKYEDAGIKTAGDAKALDDKRKHPDDATAKPTQEDDDLRPRAVIPDPGDVDYVHGDDHMFVGWKIKSSGQLVRKDDVLGLNYGEQERFWTSKHVRWRN